MSPDVALRILSADLPCHHGSVMETQRSQWVHCTDCNMPIHVDELEALQQHAQQYREAFDVLSSLVKAATTVANPEPKPRRGILR